MSGHHSKRHANRGPSASLMGSKTVNSEIERIRQSEVAYKAKIRALEVEVSTLKSRLDGLRKAKNTTIIRREREEIRISTPNLGRVRPSATIPLTCPQLKPHPPQDTSCCHQDVLERVKELNSQVNNLTAQLLSEKTRYEQLQEEARVSHSSEVATLKRQHNEEVQRMTARLEHLSKAKDDSATQELQSLQLEVEQLRETNSDLSQRLGAVLVSNEALRKGSVLLQEKSEALLEELSIKEAEWSQREDRLKEEIRKQWGERYHEWITKAEKKMEELQQINVLLQSMVKTKQDNNL